MLVEILLTSGLTYKDVRPIFEKRCAQCHSSNWPDKNWMDYETAKKHKNHIKHRVSDQSMPPGNATGLTEEERKMIIDWVDGGGAK
jgi:uncharacterized membrane protein